MGVSLYERATHRAGPMLWSGAETGPSELTRLKKDMELELARGLQMRSSVFEPCRIGQKATNQLSGMYGNGWKMAVNFADYDAWGHTKSGGYKLAISNAQVDRALGTIGPACFEAHATKDLKFYFKGAISTLADSAVFIGMGMDDTIDYNGSGGNNWPDQITYATGAFGGLDGIGFHRDEATASTAFTFAVWDANSSTNSTQTVNFPAVVDDDTVFECGFHVHGVTAITVYMKVGDAEKVQRIERVSGSTLDKLTTSLQRLGPTAWIRIGDPSTKEYLDVRAIACTQPL